MIKYILPLIITGCTSGYAPFHAEMAEVEQQMSWKEDHTDTWTSGCPPQGDCEDFALCLFYKMEKVGKRPTLHVCDRMKGMPYKHAIIELDGWYYDPTNQVAREKPTCRIVESYFYLKVKLKVGQDKKRSQK